MAESSPDPGSARLDTLVASGVGALVFAAVAIGALAPAAHGPAGHAPPPALAAKPADDPTCAEWTDGCRVCQRLEDGPACSLPGIACSLGAQECLRKAAP